MKVSLLGKRSLIDKRIFQINSIQDHFQDIRIKVQNNVEYLVIDFY